jgi:hypothetical protein
MTNKVDQSKRGDARAFKAEIDRLCEEYGFDLVAETTTTTRGSTVQFDAHVVAKPRR